MPRQKTTLSFTEARLEIEGAPSYEYDVYVRETGETRKAACAGNESFSLIAAGGKALSLFDTDEKQKWRFLQEQRAIERTYKAFPPELRYVHEHPVMEAWKSEKGKSGSQLLSFDMAYLCVAVQQLMNHGIKKGRAFELLARILPKLSPRHFEETRNLKDDADSLQRRHEESGKLPGKARKEDQKNLIDALKQIDALQKELLKSQRQCARLMEERLPPHGAGGEGLDPFPPELDFKEIQAWSAKEAGFAGGELALTSAGEVP